MQLNLWPHRFADSHRSHHCTENTEEQIEQWQVIFWIKCVSLCVCVTHLESTHIHPLCGVDETRHPGINVQLHADHWDQTQKPDILDHVGPLCQLYSLNLKNANLAKDHRSPDNLMCGLCVCVCVYMSEVEGETDKRAVTICVCVRRYEDMTRL